MRAVMTILVAFSLLPLNTSYADNFVINSGTWLHEALTPNNLLAFTATSTSGNVLVGRAFDDGGLTTPQGILPNGRPFSFSTPLQPGTGSFTLAGQTFQVGGSDGGSYNILLSGTAVAPPSLPPLAFSTTIDGFASLAGTLSLCADLSCTNQVAHTVTGAGFAGLEFRNFGGNALEFSRLEVTFTPQSAPVVPEPASLLLLGSGLVGWGIWRGGKQSNYLSK